MNLKKSTFVICLLMSGLSSPAGFAQVQLIHRHKRTCYGIIMALFATYALRNSLITTSPTSECYAITAKASSSQFESPITFSTSRPIRSRALAHVSPENRESFTANALAAPFKHDYPDLRVDVTLRPTPCFIDLSALEDLLKLDYNDIQIKLPTVY